MAKKSNSKTIYKCGGRVKKEEGGSISDKLPQYAGLGNFAGSILQKTNSPVGTIGGAMLKGAASGAALGPWGAVGGAALGLAQGLIQNKQNNESQKQQEQMLNQAKVAQSLQQFQQANKLYAQGGSLNQEQNITQYNGLQHEQGGIPLNNNAEVENNETRGIGTTEDYIYSDTLMIDPKKKITFADASKKIEKKYKGMENDRYAVKSKDRELAFLMHEQEALKKNNMDKDVAKLANKYPELFANLGQGQNTSPQTQENPGMEQLEGSNSNPQEEQMETQSQDPNQGIPMMENGGIMMNPMLEYGGNIYGNRRQFELGGDTPPDGDDPRNRQGNTYQGDTNTVTTNPLPDYMIRQGTDVPVYLQNNRTLTLPNQEVKLNSGYIKPTNNGDTPQYKTDYTNWGFKYDPNISNESTRFNQDGEFWTNDKTNSYTPEYVWKTLMDKGYSKDQIRTLQQKGYLDQLFTHLAKQPNSKFAKSQYGDDKKFGPEHMGSLEGLQGNIEGYDGPIDPIGMYGPPNFNVGLKVPPLGYNGNKIPPDGKITEGGPPTGLEENPLKPFKPDWVASGVSMLPNIGMGIGNLALANNLKFQRTNAEIMQPDYLDPTRAIQESRNQFAGAKDTIRQSAGGTGSLMSNLIGASAAQSEAQSGIEAKYDEANAGIYNQTEQYNTQNRQQTRNINAQIQMQEMLKKTQLKQEGYQNMSDALNTGINTYYQSKRDADEMNIAGGENFFYKRIGGVGNQTPVKVFKGNGYHYYEDPKTGQTRFLDAKTGKQIKDKSTIDKYTKDKESNKVNASTAERNVELEFMFSKMTPEQQQEYLSKYKIK